MTEKRWRILISVFIIWNIVAIPFTTNKPRSERNFLQEFFNPYLKWLRLGQRWPLFTPEPHRHAIKFNAEITFKDGSKENWWRPYPENWDFFQRHLAYNFQKYDLASNQLLNRALTWTDLAQFIRRMYWNDNNPPKIIKLIRSTATWPPFDNQPRYLRDHVDELKWVPQTVFIYDVVDERFEEF